MTTRWTSTGHCTQGYRPARMTASAAKSVTMTIVLPVAVALSGAYAAQSNPFDQG